MKKKRKIYRDVTDGRFTTKEDVKNRPNETVTETVEVEIVEKEEVEDTNPEYDEEIKYW